MEAISTVDADLLIDIYIQRRRGYRRLQWLGLGITTVPFILLGIYEFFVERAGTWRFALIGFVIVGIAITSYFRHKEKKLDLNYFELSDDS